MKKLIDIPEDGENGNVFEKIQIKAVKSGKKLKNYIEDLVIKDVKGK